MRPPVVPALLLVGAACTASTPLGPDIEAEPCSTINLPPSRAGAVDQWSTAGSLVLLEPTEDGGRRFVAPAANRPRRYTIERRDGVTTENVEITVPATPSTPGETPGTLPACGEFRDGVASGDPHAASVLLWTRIDVGDGPRQVSWQLSDTPSFDAPLQEGEVLANGQHDGAVTVEVEDLPAGGRWYYRFLDEEGRSSEVGRTTTLPEGAVDTLSLAVTSCSSLWSGWFNSYARIAEREDLDLVVHLGDYAYDYADENEHVRMPAEEPPDPTNPEQWRQRFRDYLRDPDLRAARAAHPFAVLWDNHDADEEADESGEGSVGVYRDYVPMRRPDPADPRIAYRSFRFGDLAEIFLVDVTTQRDPTVPSLLGTEQWLWLDGAIAASPAHHRVIGTQKLVTHLDVPGGGALVGEPTPWDQHPEERARLFAALQGGDPLILSGDLHFTVAADLVLDTASYDPSTGEGSIGVEFLPTSTTRGNFDESICDGLCDDAELAVIENIRQALLQANAHDAFLEPIEHGYGRVALDATGITAEAWYAPIHAATDDEWLGASLRAPRGQQRWTR